MTYLVYLNNYDIRQCKAQYLSVLYEVLGKNLDAHFILNKDYLEKFKEGDRWEIRWVKNHWGDYEEVYNRLKPENYTLMKKLEEILNVNEFTPSEILRYVTTMPTQEQVDVIEKILNKKDIRAGITWVNNYCFKEALRLHKIPTIHHEMGPFRPIVYHPTIYLDFSGVNGNTEFDSRFKEFLKISNEVPILTREELIRIISPNYSSRLLEILNNKNFEYEIGVGLQVEVDTNLLLFNEGRSWVDPILRAEMDCEGKILVRPHPAAGYILKPIDKRIVVDDLTKGNAQDFINKCKSIYCMNSSVGLEAILLGREAKIFGDSPFKNICNMNEDEKLLALNFTVFSYLIHRNFLFNDEYYNFRLSCIGDEKEIYLGNMKRFLKEIKKN